METLAERKDKLFKVIDGYTAFLDRMDGKEYKNRKAALLSERSKIQRDRYQIALIGHAKRGKSTLLNALLGDRNNYNLSPVNVESCTAAIIKYLDTSLYPNAPGKEGAIIYFNDETNEHIDIKEISRYVDQEDPGFRKSHAERIDHIEVYGSFPLIETRGVFIDTPGMGALYDQDNLTMNFLPDADIILCPVAADLPLEATEIEFLAKLPDAAKDKLLFLLTKADTLSESEKFRTFSRIDEILSSLKLGKRTVYPVSAKKVMTAYKEGKSDVEKIKQECGIKELETVLDQKLRNTSSAAQNIKIVCNSMLKPMFDEDKKRFTEKGEDLKSKSGELEEKQKAQEAVCLKVNDDFRKSVKHLKRDWSKVVSQFVRKLGKYEGKITNELTYLADNEGLLSLIGFSKKMARKIESRLQSELDSLLIELQEQLEKVVEETAKELKKAIDKDLEIYAKYRATGSFEAEVKTLIGGGIAVGGSALGITTVVGTLGTISAAAGTAVTTKGLLAWLASAIGMGSAGAEAAFFAALINGVIPIFGGVALTVIAYKLGTGFAKNQSRDQIPKMVEKQLQEAIVSIKKESRKMLGFVVKYFNDHLDTLLNDAKGELEKVKQNVEDLNAQTQLEEIDRNIRELDKFSLELTPLINSINNQGV